MRVGSETLLWKLRFGGHGRNADWRMGNLPVCRRMRGAACRRKPIQFRRKFCGFCRRQEAQLVKRPVENILRRANNCC
jgi:hypothetical protein